MRPSRLFLWLFLAALLFALLAVVAPFVPASLALAPVGVLIAAFAIDFLVSRKPFGLRVECNAEREVFSGESAELNFTLTGRRIPPAVTGQLQTVDGFEAVNGFVFEGDQATTKLFARRRGTWTLDRVWLHWWSRLRLIEFVPSRSIDCSINVVPNIRRITSGEIELELRSAIYGAKQTAWRGEGSEFHQLNDFVQGMDPRSIDWKRSARQNHLVAKEMRAERNHQIIMAMDIGHLMREEIDGLPKIDHKINAALALAWAGVQSGDQIGMMAFDARPRVYSPPQPGQAAFAHMRSQMAGLEYKSIETNHTLALSHLHQRLSKRSLIVVFSDFVDPLTAELLIEHVAILNRHHVVIFVSLRDPLLQKLVDGEVVAMDDIARSVSAANLLAERQLVFDHMAAMGVYVIESNPGEMSPKLINTYLAIKSREEI